MYAMFATIISNVESYMVSSVILVLNECLKIYKFPPNLWKMKIFIYKSNVT
jgi:hypothetical protein